MDTDTDTDSGIFGNSILDVSRSWLCYFALEIFYFLLTIYKIPKKIYDFIIK